MLKFIEKIRVTVFEDGERCPLLVDGRDLPVFDANVWAVNKYRSKSAATMEQALRGAMLVHFLCWRHGIDLRGRFAEGVLFDVWEVDLLATYAGFSFDKLRDMTTAKAAGSKRPNSEARLLTALPSSNSNGRVRPGTAGIRLHYALSYLMWLGDRERVRLFGGLAAGNAPEAVRSAE